ncbi:MAG: tetrahydromethanopterin S-methyltransferase subunit A [Nitrosopumilus sp.]|nr:tetrahydromethanopterin S-methyltransferase subunit A [Nitrosopumilus sp.]
MNTLGNLIGEICNLILPISEETYQGNLDSEVAVCTLSSLDLLRKMVHSDIFPHISIVGRLLSENKGIDAIIRHVNNNRKIKTIILCGKEVWGHKAGHSLLKLYENGIDNNGRIIGSSSPDPILTVSKSHINYFQNKINLVNMINETNFNKIRQEITQ